MKNEKVGKASLKRGRVRSAKGGARMTEKVLGRQPQLVSGLDGTNKAEEDVIEMQRKNRYH